VVHRDIKPANILLDQEDNAYLSDFGIAKDLLRTSEPAQADAITGSPAYVSPERIREQPVTQLSDIFSLGVVLYEILTGTHPFPADPLATLLTQHLTEPLPSIEVLRPDLSPPLDGAIKRATAKDPAERFPGVLALASAFRQALTVAAGVAESAMALACSWVTRNLTEAEWKTYLGHDVPYRRTCADLPIPPAWLTYGHLD
jgi:serine/threonine-protein kinase